MDFAELVVSGFGGLMCFFGGWFGAEGNDAAGLRGKRSGLKLVVSALFGLCGYAALFWEISTFLTRSAVTTSALAESAIAFMLGTFFWFIGYLVTSQSEASEKDANDRLAKRNVKLTAVK